MKAHYDVAIIGGGVTGMMTAHKLLQKGIRNVAVFEEKWMGSGQSNRNSGGIRAQFGSPETVRLMAASLKEWRKLTVELDYNILFRQAGYLFLVLNDENVSDYDAQRMVQNRNGINTRWLDNDEVAGLVPGIRRDIITGGNYHALDGTAHHDAVLNALRFSVARQGGELHEHAPVTSLSFDGDGRGTIKTPLGSATADFVVCAAAAKSPGIAAMAGIDLPVMPYRRELLVTEPLRHFLGPMIVSLKFGLTAHQTLRGEVVGNTRVAEPESFDTKGSLPFLVQFAKDVTHLLPFMKYVKVVRHWAGTYDVTPDGSPIICPAPRIPHFIIAAGSSGHGFMMAPEVGKLVAEYITTGTVPEIMRPFSIDRFERGELLKESSVTGKKLD